MTENKRSIFPRALEDEAIYIIREVAAQFEKPALLFSGGKDSITLVHLARKAFFPARVPFPMLHIDTGHNFEETIVFRDWLAAHTGMQLIVRYVQDTINDGKVKEETGKYASRNVLQTTTLLGAIEELNHSGRRVARRRGLPALAPAAVSARMGAGDRHGLLHRRRAVLERAGGHSRSGPDGQHRWRPGRRDRERLAEERNCGRSDEDLPLARADL